ncbi:DUF6998 domain-containing protein [Kushneria sinocarnis]|uniref:DUF6998 domain-containing protein n=1 Tax=Kushneria sinocarnis TaxID=595502 RepID=UPI003CCC7CC1
MNQEHLLVLSRPKGQSIEVVYNGPGALAWNAAGRKQSNGQRPIRLAKLTALDAELSSEDRLPLAREAPV